MSGILVNRLKTIGVDVTDYSSGKISRSATVAAIAKRQLGFQVPYAAQVRVRTGKKTMAVGLITDPRLAEEILNDGSSDLMVIRCQALENLNWPLCVVQAMSKPKF